MCIPLFFVPSDATSWITLPDRLTLLVSLLIHHMLLWLEAPTVSRQTVACGLVVVLKNQFLTRFRLTTYFCIAPRVSLQTPVDASAIGSPSLFRLPRSMALGCTSSLCLGSGNLLSTPRNVGGEYPRPPLFDLQWVLFSFAP